MTKKSLYLLLLLVLFGLFLTIKYQSPQWTEHLFQQNAFNLLNKLTGATETKSLDYYKGEMELALFGPLQSIISGILFLLIALKFLPQSNSLKFAFSVLGYLILTRPEAFLSPPFGEGVTGPFTDVLWLANNDLNYFKFLKQETFTTGGMQIYPTALYPLFLAALMRLITNPAIFLFILHSLYFLMASAIITMVRNTARATFQNEKIAILTALLVLFLPIFQSMSELLNLEIPCLFFTLLGVYLALRERWLIASLSALAAVFVKDPGIIAGGAVFSLAALKFLKHPKQNWKILIWPLLGVILAVLKSVLRAKIVGEQKNFNMVSLGAGWQNNIASPWFYLFLISFIIILITNIPRFKNLIKEQLPASAMVLTAGLWFLLFNNFLTLAYRYQLLLMPFVIFTIIFAISQLIKKEQILNVLIFLFMGFALINSHGLIYGGKTYVAVFGFFGRLYPEPGRLVLENTRKEYLPTNLERSLEYRNYLKLEMNLAKEIEKNYGEFSVVAPFQTAQILAMPQLGYVKKNLDVTGYGMRATLAVKQYRGIQNFDLKKTVWIGFPHHVLDFVDIPFPVDPKDIIIKKMEVGRIETDIFLGGKAVERMWRVITCSQKAPMPLCVKIFKSIN